MLKRGIVASKTGISVDKNIPIEERSWSSEDESLTRVKLLEDTVVVDMTGTLTGTSILYHNLGYFPFCTGVGRTTWVAGSLSNLNYDTGWIKLPGYVGYYVSSDGGYYTIYTTLTIYIDRVEVYYELGFTQAVPMATIENPLRGPMTMEIKVNCYSLELGS